MMYLTVNPGLLVGKLLDLYYGHDVVDTSAGIRSHMLSVVLYAARTAVNMVQSVLITGGNIHMLIIFMKHKLQWLKLPTSLRMNRHLQADDVVEFAGGI